MTCIIGAKCSDGVVLTADRKIIDHDTKSYYYDQKLFQYYYPIVVGSSGSQNIFNNFKRDALEMAQNIRSETTPQYQKHDYQISGLVHVLPSSTDMSSIAKSAVNLYPYIEKLREIIKKYRKIYSHLPFAVLFAAQTQEKGAYLEYIDEEGAPSDIYDSYKVIGSGEMITNAFLRSLWRSGMTMDQFAEIAYFIIRYFDRFNIDYEIGLGGMRPQVWFIPNDLDKKVEEADGQILDRYENTTNTMFENLTQYGIKKLL